MDRRSRAGRLACVLALAMLPSAAAAQSASRPPSGEALYKTRCAACHDNADGRTPSKATLRAMTSTRIMRTLDFGAMMTIAFALRRDEREAIAAYLGKPGGEPGPRPQAYCADRRVTLGDMTVPSWNGWSPERDNTRFVPGVRARLTIEQVSRLKLKWAFGFEGDIAAFAEPTVIGNQIFIGSASGVVHAMRADTGCLQWTFQANGPIRSAIVATPFEGRHLLVFGDLTGWLYALDAATGQQVWRVRPEAHEAVRLSAAPVLHEGLIFVPVASWEESRALNADYPCCTFRGSVVALRLRDGGLAWKRYMIPDAAMHTGKPTGAETFGPSGVAIWGAVTLDLKRRRLYVTTGNNYSLPATAMSDAIVALDLDTGNIVWSRQALPNDVYNSACSLTPKAAGCPEGNGPDYDFGSPAILVTTTGGRELLLAGQKAGIVWAFDPDNSGTVVWQSRVAKGGINGGVQWGMASDGTRVYAATSDAAVTRTATARVLDPSAGGGVTALRISDGSVEWHAEPPPCAGRANCSPAQSAAVTAIPGAVFAGSLDGHLRAYSAIDGKMLWDFDSVRDYQTVNGVKGSGGAIDGAGPIVVNGMVLVTSGYPRFGGIAGNVLLAFAPE